ncbi:DUF2922 domain-containing protein [Virgibacillus sp. L01]|uniref:DUF2922 domain-containing protein n=1 Tax=Virgibacillus sp. L01 TaxID=3457429 RepID=UPI003FD48A98
MEKPIEPVDPVAVKAAMDEIIAQDAFTSFGGSLVTIKSARAVERNVWEVELA